MLVYGILNDFTIVYEMNNSFILLYSHIQYRSAKPAFIFRVMPFDTLTEVKSRRQGKQCQSLTPSFGVKLMQCMKSKTETE